MRILRRAEYRRMPWKNGQGLTEEVAIFPPGSPLDGFDWRISIAHVSVAGPFSPFPGVDRSIALLDGDGLVLDLPNGDVTLVAPSEPPFSFPGEWDISSRNIGGPTIDLNIMTKRDRCTHRLFLHIAMADAVDRWDAEVALIANADAVVQQDGVDIAVGRFDCVMLSPGEPFAVARDRAEFLAAEIRMTA